MPYPHAPKPLRESAEQAIQIDENTTEVYNDGKQAFYLVRVDFSKTFISKGDRVRVVAGFHVGAVGTVEFVEPSGKKYWVLRDGSSGPVFYHREELERE